MCRKRQEEPAVPPNTPTSGMASTQQNSQPLRPSINSATQEVVFPPATLDIALFALHVMTQSLPVYLDASESPATAPSNTIELELRSGSS